MADGGEVIGGAGGGKVQSTTMRTDEQKITEGSRHSRTAPTANVCHIQVSRHVQ